MSAARGGAGRVTLTADIALLTIREGELCALLVERADAPGGSAWALPGGLVGAAESAEGAARRILLAETGMDALPGGAHLEQLATYSDPGRDPRARVVSVAHLAFAPRLPAPEPGADGASVRWWPVADLGGDEPAPLAFDHAQILADAIERVRAKLEYSTLAAAFLDEPFTLSQLHRVYAAVWGEGPHLPNFRRKVMSTPGFVTRANPDVPSTPALFRRGPARWLQPPMLRPRPDEE